MKTLHSKYFILSTIAALFTLVPPVQANSGKNVRGVTQEEAPSNALFIDSATNSLHYPRKALDVSLLGITKTAAFLSDEDVIETIKDILYIYEEKLAWFPYAKVSSGFRPSYGGGLYYHERESRALLMGSYADDDYWNLKLKLSHQLYMNGKGFKLKLEGELGSADDERFYGVGADPHNDGRTVFQTDDDYGVFTEKKRKVLWSTTYEPTSNLDVRYLGYYQRRSFKNRGRGNKDLNNVFALSSIPGFINENPVSQLYNEFALKIDTRTNKKMLTPGSRAEIYGGLSTGLSATDADLLRAGFDLAAFIPLIREDRILIPRVIFNLVENVNGDEIPFTEYARHNTFRGISNNTLLRNDKVSIVPSIEYAWPISQMFTGHLFIDYLAVGRSISNIAWDNGLWAGGAGFEFHWLEREWGRIEVAGGSEGMQLTFSIGVPIERNDRGDW